MFSLLSSVADYGVAKVNKLGKPTLKQACDRGFLHRLFGLMVAKPKSNNKRRKCKMMEKIGSLTNLPLTLERHFEVLAKESPAVENLHSLWVLLRKDLEDMLPLSRNTFVHYSLHDATHSRSVIQAIERFLGEERIKCLSATDTFMLLLCAYAHDYGMAMSFTRINEALGSSEFTDYL